MTDSGASALAAPALLPVRTGRPRRRRLQARLIAIDAAAIAAAFFLALTVRGSGPINTLNALAILLPIYGGAAVNNRGYAGAILDRPDELTRRGAQALLLAVAALVIVLFYAKLGESFSRLQILFGSASALVFLAIGRRLFGRWVARTQDVLLTTLVIHDGDGGPWLSGDGGRERAEWLDPTLDQPAMVERLARTVRGVDRAVIDCPVERRDAWGHLLKGLGVQVELLVPRLATLRPLHIGAHDGTPTVVLLSGGMAWFDRVVKRAFDLVVAGAALVVLAVPMAAVALAIRLESPGPALFRQSRVGYANLPFTMLKFRTMRVDVADARGDRSTARADDRVTRVGRLLRRTSLDELPQFLNVLGGSMSVVGPRPHAPGSLAGERLFWHVDRRYRHRHMVPPGLTGLAQVRGFRGATHADRDLVDRLEADLEYAAGWSLMGDVAIVVRTLAVLVHPNAF